MSEIVFGASGTEISVRWTRKRPSSAHSNTARPCAPGRVGNDGSRSHSPMNGSKRSSMVVSSS